MRVKEIVINEKTEKCTDINLLVGANNTGKTTFVANFYHRFIDFKPDNLSPWVNGFTMEIKNYKSKFLDFLKDVTGLVDPAAACADLDQKGATSLFGANSCSSILAEVLSKGDEKYLYTLPMQNTDDDWGFFNSISRLASTFEHPENRLQGPYNTTIENVNSYYHDFVHYLFAEKKQFSKISEHIRSVFGIELVFDDLPQGLKQIRLALTKPIPESLGLRELGIFWESNSRLLQYQGNGVRAYWQLLISLINPIKSIFFMDEPEIFLHSPQRRRLGQDIGNASKQGKQFFIATHDSEFIRGVLSTYPKAQLIYLIEKDGKRDYKIIPISNDVRTPSYNESFLNVYFNKLTILCEAEDDRTIYQFALKKYFAAESVDIHFIGLNGKAEVKSNFNELKSQGIKTVAIYDFDALRSGEYNDKEIIDVIDWKSFDELRQDLDNAPKEEKKHIKERGLSQISNISLRERAKLVINKLVGYGIFIVPLGELESWQDEFRNNRFIQNLINEIEEEDQKPKKIELRAFLGRIVEFYKKGD